MVAVESVGISKMHSEILRRTRSRSPDHCHGLCVTLDADLDSGLDPLQDRAHVPGEVGFVDP